jgi:DNA-binding response OmpR family regulator
MARENILIVDDEAEISGLIQSYLAKEEFHVRVVDNGVDALQAVRHEKTDLIILDIMLPDIDGIELCLEIRKNCDTPILFLSCKAEEIDKILALSVGGDDYLTKPFLPGELVARVKAHLRRNRLLKNDIKQTQVIRYPGLEVDLDNREVWVGKELVNLSSKEFEILSILIRNPKRIYSMDQLFEMVWKMTSLDGDSRTIMVYISNLRKKIETDPYNPQYITNVRGVCYKLNHSNFEKSGQ